MTTKAKTTIAVAIVLVGVMLATVFGIDLGGLLGTLGIVLLVAIIGAFIALLLYMARSNRQVREFIDNNNAAVAAVSKGELDKAIAIYEPYLSSPNTTVMQQARHGFVIALMRKGELGTALATLLPDADEAATDVLLSTDLATAYALRGDLDDAERWLREADNHPRGSEAPHPSMRAVARAVIDCRRDRCADAARRLADDWAQHEAAMTAQALRPLRIVRAFALSSGGVRDAGVATSALADVRPMFRGELDYLGVAWPEMATFLTTHGLSSKTA